MDKEIEDAKRLTSSIPRTPGRGKNEIGDEPVRWCGCPTPKDYPKIDIHNSKCKRRGQLEGLTVGKMGEIPKVYPSGRKLPGSDAPRTVTPTHQSKQWFFGHDYSAFVDPGGSVWLAMAKRFDKRYNKP
jgi:hypothetical protein